jgi:hypothetical protein
MPMGGSTSKPAVLFLGQSVVTVVPPSGGKAYLSSTRLPLTGSTIAFSRAVVVLYS